MSKTDFLSLKGTLKTSSNFGILEALTAVKYTCDNLPTPWNKALLERYLLAIPVKELRVKYHINHDKFAKENKKT